MKRILLSLALTALIGCGDKTPLPVYGEIPDFVLTAETGGEFDGRSLRGKIWVADFIFTNCAGPCPRMSSQMRHVQNQVKGLDDVRLISFTVDPERDTPEVLATYAKQYDADPERWRFLTGPGETLHHLKREAFKLGDVDGQLNHSTRFVLVDREARIRGYYGTMEGGAMNELVRDIRRLARESS